MLIIISWLPIAQLVLFIAHNNQHLTSKATSTEFRAIVWGIQIIIGLIGVWLVGKLAVQTAKQDGLKKAPVNMWQLFKNGPSD